MRVLVIALVIAGCSKSKVKECDDLIALGEKVARCEQISPASRKIVGESIDQMRKAMKVIEDLGDQAPKDQLETLGKTCQLQSDGIREMYEKVAPECLK